MTYIHEIFPHIAYQEVISKVLDHGIDRQPRGRKTKDLGYTIIEIEQPWNALPFGVRPNLSARVAAVEAIQLIGGFATPRLMVAASPKFAEYREPTGQFWGAYGERVGHQVSCAVDKLKKDPDTRQAVVTLWDPLRDNQPGKLDYPCTIALQFQLERGKLCLTVTMRSNDAWLGLPYDMFQFTQLQLTVANLLVCSPGTYRHVAWSMHLYEENYEQALDTLHREPAGSWQPEGLKVSSPECNYGDVRKAARSLTFDPVGPYATYDDSNYWYATRLGPLIKQVESEHS